MCAVCVAGAQVSEVTQGTERDDQSVRSALLSWCQACTFGYEGVSVRDFGRSWADGRALLALLHRHQPQLFAEGFSGALRTCRTPRERLRMAFDLARDHLGVQALLDPEGIRIIYSD